MAAEGAQGRVTARRVAAAAALAAALVAGAWIGWVVRDHRDPPPPIVVRRSVTVVSDAPARDGTTPSVVGLDVDAARQAFADAGIAAASIEVASRPHVGPADAVVSQTPAAAAPIGSARPRLVVAVAATVPQLVGKDEAAARAALQDLGADVRVLPRFRAGAEEGSVLKTTPAAGEPLGPEVTLVVAQAESSVRLADLDAVDTSCGKDVSVEVGGASQEHALQCGTAADFQQALAVDLGGNASRLVARLSLPDDAPDGAQARFRVRVDDRLVGTGAVGRADDAALDVRLAGARRVAIELAGDDRSPTVAVLDAVISGSRAGIDRLTSLPSP